MDIPPRKIRRDLTGFRFGRLEVLKPVGRTANCETVWRCNCSCGNVVDVIVGNLTSGNSRSCGCANAEARASRAKDICGLRSGHLIAKYQTNERNSHGSLMWMCLCDCGKKKAVASSDLISGQTISCGCARKKWKPIRNITIRLRKLKNQNNRRARELSAKGIITNSDVEKIYNLQRCKCAWCRKPLKFSLIYRDHIIPLALGGTNYPRNIQLLCRACNARKQAIHPIEFAQREGRLI
ncbi:MAG: HNH endonuclease [Patescibacteria group bacterium]|nr:HNH endonuclease [Patescibacteria group bacterium]